MAYEWSIEALEKDLKDKQQSCREFDGLDYVARNRAVEDLESAIALLKALSMFSEQVQDRTIDKIQERGMI
jgi:hypothetical protein